jgi:cytochrome c peroxidase
MKKLIIIPGLLATVAWFAIFSCQPKGMTPEKAIAKELLAQVDSFTAVCKKMQLAVGGGEGAGAVATAGVVEDAGAVRENRLQDLFLQARLAYKKFEWAAEYFEPAASRFVNGPPVQEVEASSRQVFEPAGLQVIEGFLFPRYDTVRRAELTRQLGLLQTRCRKYATHFGNIDLFDWQVFDAAKLEIFRVETLGIAGFDNPLTLKSSEESAVVLESLRVVLGHYAGDLSHSFVAATRYLARNTDFNSFDRAAFILRYGDPLTIGISNLERRLKIYVIKYNRLLNQDAKTLFDRNAFNLNAYSPDQASFISPEKIVLGKVLFSDAVLSGTGTRSCQSCHEPDKAFTDGLVKNTVIGDKRVLRRNTPTLINAGLQPSQFYDLRVNTLEDQALTVVQNIEEMHGAMNLSIQRLWQDKRYKELFAGAFPRKDRTGIDTLEVMNAIGSYVRSLTLLNSRFDDYMRGDRKAMNVAEVNGFNLFMGKAKCGTCHYMPLFNGTFPPRYIRTESEVIGVPGDTVHVTIDQDMGRFGVIALNSFRHAFKTSTIRNAARTAPYMHNGVFSTLQQVVDFYDKGGGKGLGIKMENQTLPADKLGLTGQEKAEIIAFIRCLDSK